MSSFPENEIPQTPRAKRWLDDGSSSDGDIIDLLPNTDGATSDKLRHLEPGRGLLDPGAFRSLTATPESLLAETPARFLAGRTPHEASQEWRFSARDAVDRFWARNRGVVLVAVAQLFAALMHLAARLLELEGEGMHPFQILFARMSLTTLLSCIYMYYTKVPHFPLGPKEVRWLLITRGITGFFGIYGMWYSLMYLPLAEATVISFLAPCVSSYICHVVLHDPFTRKEQIASFLALAGIVFIAQPMTLFGALMAGSGNGSGAGGDASTTPPPPASSGADGVATTNVTRSHPQIGEEATPAERLSAIGMALLGVLGGAIAFVCIRWIGRRAHPLVSVNYFSTCCTVVSTTVLFLAPLLNVGQPEIHFALPVSGRQWLLLVSLGISGFIMQFMVTAGLGGEKSNRATTMAYTQMLFAAVFDKWVFGHAMSTMSLIGCGFILGSALWVAVTKKEEQDTTARPQADVEAGRIMEGIPMLEEERRDREEEQDSSEESIPLQQFR